GKNCALHAAEPFVIAEEEYFVAAIENFRDDYRTASRKAELVLAKFALGNAAGIFEEISGVQLVIAEEFPSGAMEAVGAGLDRGVEHRGTRASEFGAEVRSLNLEFLNGVDRRKHDEIGSVQEVHGVGVVVDAVEQIVVLRRAVAVRGEGPTRGIPSRVGLR